MRGKLWVGFDRGAARCAPTLIVLVVWLLTSCGGATGTLNDAKADSLALEIQAALATFDVPGAAFALVWPDGAYTAGFGVADIASGQAVTPESRFAVASAIKPSVALWMDERIRSGAIRWETPLAELWPSLNLGAAGQVTLAQAVDQTAGYPREDWAWIGRELSAADLSDLMRQANPIAPPGQIFTYHNVLFALALRGIEAYTGESFPIFPPDVTGYDRALDGRLIPLSKTARQPGLMSVVLDAGLSASDAVGVLRRLLAAETLFATETVSAAGAYCCPLGANVRYGRGLFVEQYAGVTLWLHDGDGLGFTAAIMLDPAAGIGMFIAANRGGADDFIHALRYAVIERAYGLIPSGAAALRDRWARESNAQQDFARRTIAPVESDSAFAGEYGSALRLRWDSENGLTVYRGVYEWRLRSFAPGYAVFDHGPLIGQSVDFVCADGVRRIVSRGTVLGEGGLCR